MKKLIRFKYLLALESYTPNINFLRSATYRLIARNNIIFNLGLKARIIILSLIYILRLSSSLKLSIVRKYSWLKVVNMSTIIMMDNVKSKLFLLIMILSIYYPRLFIISWKCLFINKNLQIIIDISVRMAF